jgi:hypothetical protein
MEKTKSQFKKEHDILIENLDKPVSMVWFRGRLVSVELANKDAVRTFKELTYPAPILKNDFIIEGPRN